MNHPVMFICFNLFVLAMLALDLGVFHRDSRPVRMREALGWVALWIALGLSFNAGLYFFWPEPEHRGRIALEFLTGYLIEYSLSMDNIFVFIMIFSYFRVPAQYQHKILFWGILGALIMRGVMIFAGIALIQKFHWLIYIFGGFLVVTGIRMFAKSEIEIHPERNPVLRVFRKLMPVTADYEDEKFVVRRAGKLFATPMLVTLLFVETTDLIFALDSIPAVMAISKEPIIIYTSNVFAILGLRALYFALAGLMGLFHYLRFGLALILIFVGIKMIIAEFYKIPIGIALGVVAGLLVCSVGASMIFPVKPVEVEEIPDGSMNPEDAAPGFGDTRPDL